MPHRCRAFHRPFALSVGRSRVLGAIEFSTDVKCCDESDGRFMPRCGTAILERVATPVLARSFRSLRRGVLGGDLAPGGTDLGGEAVAFAATMARPWAW